jgi:hypothetical protein
LQVPGDDGTLARQLQLDLKQIVTNTLQGKKRSKSSES